MTPAFDHLKNGQQQADEDGIMVLVSRQAVDEVLSEYAELEAGRLEVMKENARLWAKVERLEEAGDEMASNLTFLANHLTGRMGDAAVQQMLDLADNWADAVMKGKQNG